MPNFEKLSIQARLFLGEHMSLASQRTLPCEKYNIQCVKYKINGTHIRPPKCALCINGNTYHDSYKISNMIGNH